MESCADRICRALRIRDMKQAELSERTGIPKSAISQYCSGAFKPKQQRLFSIAEVLDVDEAWLMGLDVPMERNGSRVIANIIPMPEMRKIPLLGNIACGAPILADDHIEEYIDIPRHVNADFALTCKGDSMINARIFNGDIVYIRQQDTVDDGQIAAVLIDDEATLKRVRVLEDRIVLEPANPLYDPLVFRGEEMNTIRILGKAVAFTSAVR
ncbi:MAG: helix-turn-helix domain-containing protein [Ruminococcaceae bacterium]|nr:helix-turn-helix domain-containing protein [Oscillospiraceae bacterium]